MNSRELSGPECFVDVWWVWGGPEHGVRPQLGFCEWSYIVNKGNVDRFVQVLS